ncbi:SDR family NAD(P)-dependent oxidoreductase [Rhodovarius crocodyli]|uniref:SDR family NAD(P)-dependent oxidoreductase n=1 Tax=Rhodovarius crocodyli TaxID=1979269 RepID=A0A437MEU2_9PROT|nr:SDR family oxidoreductase [Rhodovarius crocodyli]RVT96180.1 SDR family NAD(P)-dependent oxidoreductase [Rhodovarius crocodyli]
MKPTGNTILVTGGGSGIGAALAQRLHDAGNTVIVAGRRLEALREACAGRANMHAMALDIDSAAAIDAFAAALIAAHPALNVVLNNAGIMRFEALDTRRDLADAEATITTNLLGPIRLTNALVEHLAARPDAALINVTSGLAFVPLLSTPTYNATKAAMHSYTVALREELKGRVEVIELAPPAVQTGLTPGQENRPGYMPLAEFIDEVLSLLGQNPTPPEILVQRVRFLRDAEAEGRFDATLAQLNAFAAQALASQPG